MRSEAKKMESFTIFRKYLAMIGIVPEQSPKNLLLKNSTIIILGILYGVSLGKLLNEANTFEEYADFFNRMIVTYLFCVSYTIMVVWKSTELFRLVNNLESSITKSKSHSTE